MNGIRTIPHDNNYLGDPRFILCPSLDPFTVEADNLLSQRGRCYGAEIVNWVEPMDAFTYYDATVRYRRLSQLNDPSLCVYIGDSVGGPAVPMQIWAMHCRKGMGTGLEWLNLSGAHLRHSERGNMAFFDGHAEAADIGLLKKANFNRVYSSTLEVVFWD